MANGRPQGATPVPAADDRIMAATLHGLTRLDPAALTIQAICREAQVTPPTLYYHYGSKDGLLAAAVERLAGNWMALLDAAVPRRGDLEETLTTVEAGWEAMILSPERPLAVLAWVTLLSAESSPPSRAALAAARDRGHELVKQALLPHLPGDDLASDVASVVVDAVIAAALDHLLDQDVAAVRRRLAAVTRTVRLMAQQPATA